MYKENIDQVVKRHELLWSRRLSRGILAILDVEDAPCDPYNLPKAFLNTEYDPLAQSPDIEKMFHAWDSCFQLRRQLNDDWLPVARIGLGGYEVGGILGGSLAFEGGAPWLKEPLVHEWDELGNLYLDSRGHWYRHRLEMCDHFSKQAADTFACCEADNITAGNLIELLRGSKAYLDIIDSPDNCVKIAEMGVDWTEALVCVQRERLGNIRRYNGGSFHNFYIWLPGDAVWLSMDFYGQCGPGVYTRIGLDQDQTLIDRLGGGWVHMHSNGLHILQEVATLHNLKGLQIWEDPPPNPRPFSSLSEIRAITKDIPLYISCRFDEFQKGLTDKTLPGGILYEVKGVPNINEGNRMMQKVWDYESSCL